MGRVGLGAASWGPAGCWRGANQPKEVGTLAAAEPPVLAFQSTMLFGVPKPVPTDRVLSSTAIDHARYFCSPWPCLRSMPKVAAGGGGEVFAGSMASHYVPSGMREGAQLRQGGRPGSLSLDWMQCPSSWAHSHCPHFARGLFLSAATPVLQRYLLEDPSRAVSQPHQAGVPQS